MLRLTHCPFDSAVESDSGLRITTYIDDRSEAGLIPEGLQIKWRKQFEPEWDSVYLNPTVADSFEAVIPAHDDDVVIEYYIQAGDSSGRFEVLPRGAPEGFYSFYILPGPVDCGDANNDGAVNVSDAVYVINFAFDGGPAPEPLEAADCNCDSRVNVSDAVYIINFAFAGGNPPCDPDGNGEPDC
jgi:hypothetical protein